MIATHNIKVNGRWVAAGEEYEEKPEVNPVEEEPKPKRTATRRKKISE